MRPQNASDLHEDFDECSRDCFVRQVWPIDDVLFTTVPRLTCSVQTYGKEQVMGRTYWSDDHYRDGLLSSAEQAKRFEYHDLNIRLPRTQRRCMTR